MSPKAMDNLEGELAKLKEALNETSTNFHFWDKEYEAVCKAAREVAEGKSRTDTNLRKAFKKLETAAQGKELKQNLLKNVKYKECKGNLETTRSVQELMKNTPVKAQKQVIGKNMPLSRGVADKIEKSKSKDKAGQESPMPPSPSSRMRGAAEKIEKLKSLHTASQKGPTPTTLSPRLLNDDVDTLTAQAIPVSNDWDTCNLDFSHGRAVWKCINCGDFLCLGCTSLHRKGRLTRQHRLMNFDERSQEAKIRNEVFCRVHTNNELVKYCIDDAQAICTECTITTHKGHSFEEIGLQADAKRSQVGSALAAADKQIPKYETMLKDLNEEVSQAERSTVANMKVIDSVTESLIDRLRKRSKELKNKESVSLRELKQDLRRRETKVETFLKNQTETILNSRKFLETCSDNELIQNAEGHIRRLTVPQPSDTFVTAKKSIREYNNLEIEEILKL